MRQDIARVELGAQDYSIAARNGWPAGRLVAVRMAPGANALDTAKAVKERWPNWRATFPRAWTGWCPTTLRPLLDISIREVLKTLAEAMLLVVLVMYLFLENVRATFIPTIVVPVALVGARSAFTPSGTRSTC